MSERRAVVSISRAFKITRGVIAASAVGLLGMSLAQCSADSGGSSVSVGGSNAGGSGNSGGSSTGGVGAGFDGSISGDVAVKDYSAEEFFIEDPPPQGCDGGGVPVVPGGTPECPDDKNLPGCPCSPEGKTAACWPGLRKHRNRGDCKDGTTTCQKIGEIQTVWGPCEGYQGINPNTLLPYGTTGKAACTCFSGGFWKIDNLSPCFVSSSPTTVLGAISTVMPGNCPSNAGTMDWNNPVPPSEPWSTNYVTSDCTGYFKLCFTLKGLAAPGAPQAASDCVMKQVCTEAYYAVANQQQKFPDLPGWVTATAAEKSCAQKFVSNGGYAELSVVGESDECDKINKVFQKVTYCPLKCAASGTGTCGNKTCDAGETATNCASDCDPDCKNCTNGGGGPF
jgi:hypothetical protein